MLRTDRTDYAWQRKIDAFAIQRSVFSTGLDRGTARRNLRFHMPAQFIEGRADGTF